MNMDLNFLMDYINPVILGICLLVGYVIKTAIPAIKNRYIPLAALAMGTIIAILINMSNGINAEVVLGGMISGLASTGFYEMLRNLIDKDGKKKAENGPGEEGE
nr:MAG TPA: holin [Caudoviricetes sp.]